MSAEVVKLAEQKLKRYAIDIKKRWKRSFDDHLAVGEMLLDTKLTLADLGLGWYEWLKENLGCSPNTASNYINIFNANRENDPQLLRVAAEKMTFYELCELVRPSLSPEARSEAISKASTGDQPLKAVRAARGSGGGRGRARGASAATTSQPATTPQNTAAGTTTPPGGGRGGDPGNPTTANAQPKVASPSPLVKEASTRDEVFEFLDNAPTAAIVAYLEQNLPEAVVRALARKFGMVLPAEVAPDLKASHEALQAAQTACLEAKAEIERQAREITRLKEKLDAKSSSVPPQPASGASLAATPATIYRDFASLDLHGRLKAIDLIADQLDNGKDEANRHRMSYCTAFFANIRTEEWRDKVRRRLIPEDWAARQPSSSTDKPVIQNLNSGPSPDREPQDLRRQWAPGEGLKKQTSGRKPPPRPNGNGNGGHRNGYGEDGF